MAETRPTPRQNLIWIACTIPITVGFMLDFWQIIDVQTGRRIGPWDLWPGIALMTFGFLGFLLDHHHTHGNVALWQRRQAQRRADLKDSAHL